MTRRMLVIAVLALILPTLACADEFDNEIRLLDLELQMLHLRQEYIGAKLREASREGRSFMKTSRPI